MAGLVFESAIFFTYASSIWRHVLVSVDGQRPPEKQDVRLRIMRHIMHPTLALLHTQVSPFCLWHQVCFGHHFGQVFGQHHVAIFEFFIRVLVRVVDVLFGHFEGPIWRSWKLKLRGKVNYYMEFCVWHPGRNSSRPWGKLPLACHSRDKLHVNLMPCSLFSTLKWLNWAHWGQEWEKWQELREPCLKWIKGGKNYSFQDESRKLKLKNNLKINFL